MNLDTVREVGTAENKTFYARGIGLSPLALARLNPDTVREVGTVENKTFYARAGLNPGTIREVGTVENKTFCAHGIGLVPLALARLNLDTIRARLNPGTIQFE